MEMVHAVHIVKYWPAQKSLAPKNQILPMENTHSDSMQPIQKTTEIICINNNYEMLITCILWSMQDIKNENEE